MPVPLTSLITESRNSASSNIDTLSTLEMLKVINDEDKKVALAVQSALPEIARAVDLISAAFHKNGRLVYCGAGTSGRLGILDASECPPTFGTPADQVIGLIAGGQKAILKAVENAEDNQQAGKSDLQNLNFNKNDILVGIAASGRTPYVIGAMQYAKSINAQVVSISCNPNSSMSKMGDINICAVVGPEVVTGSSRLKAGTAQKLILNMLTTGAMIRIGKVFTNLMVDVQATNAKLVERQKSIVMAATDCRREEAEMALSQCNGHCKTAIVMILTNSDAHQAKLLLTKNNGFIRQAVSRDAL